jgi:[ribosomal protein S18]-alanine N-acetyltransferase
MSETPGVLPPGLRIRPMQAADLAQVSAIDKACFAMPWPDNSYRFELFENPGSELFVAELAGGSLAAGEPVADPAAASSSAAAPAVPVIIGMIVVWVILDEAHIATIATDQAYRNLGIARELLAAGLAPALRRGCLSATLEVRLNNLPAQRLYRRFGFEVVGRRPRYYRDNNEDALIMTVSGLDQAYLDWLESGAWRTASAPASQEISNNNE